MRRSLSSLCINGSRDVWETAHYITVFVASQQGQSVGNKKFRVGINPLSCSPVMEIPGWHQAVNMRPSLFPDRSQSWKCFAQLFFSPKLTWLPLVSPAWSQPSCKTNQSLLHSWVSFNKSRVFLKCCFPGDCEGRPQWPVLVASVSRRELKDHRSKQLGPEPVWSPLP